MITEYFISYTYNFFKISAAKVKNVGLDSGLSCCLFLCLAFSANDYFL